MKIFISGALGRMGQEIQALIKADKNLKYVGGFDRKDDKAQGIVSSLAEAPSDIDVIIDFSLPEAFNQIVEWSVEKKISLVSGTTGISDSQKNKLEEASKEIAVLWAANMAPGVHVVKQLLRQIKLLSQFDIQMTEYHHIHKKDKPSGTALMLQKELDQRRDNLPEPLSIRGGGIFGIHKVDFMAPEEVITIEHQALSRTVFARGAVDVAQWLSKKPKGLYTMDDFIS